MNIRMILAVLVVILMVAAGWYYMAANDSTMAMDLTLTVNDEGTINTAKVVFREGRPDSSGLYPGIHRLKIEVWTVDRGQTSGEEVLYADHTLWVWSKSFWKDDRPTASISFPEMPTDGDTSGYAHFTLKIYYDGELHLEGTIQVDASYNVVVNH